MNELGTSCGARRMVYAKSRLPHFPVRSIYLHGDTGLAFRNGCFPGEVGVFVVCLSQSLAPFLFGLLGHKYLLPSPVLVCSSFPDSPVIHTFCVKRPDFDLHYKFWSCFYHDRVYLSTSSRQRQHSVPSYIQPDPETVQQTPPPRQTKEQTSGGCRDQTPR